MPSAPVLKTNGKAGILVPTLEQRRRHSIADCSYASRKVFSERNFLFVVGISFLEASANSYLVWSAYLVFYPLPPPGPLQAFLLRRLRKWIALETEGLQMHYVGNFCLGAV